MKNRSLARCAGAAQARREARACQAIEDRLRIREAGYGWLKEFDVRIESRIAEREFEENAIFRAEKPFPAHWEFAATANAARRLIKIYRATGGGIDTLALVAHEIGHVALNHWGQRPDYIQEFEAERFAKELFARDGFRYLRRLEWHGRIYVQGWIYRGLRHGLRSVDPRIARWAKVGSDWDHGGEARERYREALGRRPARDYWREASERLRRALGRPPGRARRHRRRASPAVVAPARHTSNRSNFHTL